jgi:hypothetical protein
VLVCDRDLALHPVSLSALAAARGSTCRPFPPRHKSWTFDVTGWRAPRPDEVRAAIVEVAQGMLRPPIGNLGVRGIRKTAQLVPHWPAVLERPALRDACRDGYIMIDATGGTGGGMFRYMYARFLDEAALVTGDAGLGEIAKLLRVAGDRWQDVATALREAAAGDPATELAAVPALLTVVADTEEAAWRDLLSRCG